MKPLTTPHLRPQRHTNVAQILRTQFGCQHLPADFLKFLQTYDGMHTPSFTIFALDDSDTQIVMTFKQYANAVRTTQYLQTFPNLPPRKFFFFAADAFGGRFAFVTDVVDERVYYFNAVQPRPMQIYASFTDLLKQMQPEFGARYPQ